MPEERRGHVLAFQIHCLGAAVTGVNDRVSAQWPDDCILVLRRILLDVIEYFLRRALSADAAPLAAAGRSELLLLAAAGRSELLLLALLAAGW